MFEVKDTPLETIMIGNPVDIVEFAKRWGMLYKEQHEMLMYGDFEGNIDEYALYLGYCAPASSAFRQRLRQLASLGLIVCTEKGFENLEGDKMINRLLSLNVKELPRYNSKTVERKGIDHRAEVSKERHIRYLKTKEEN